MLDDEAKTLGDLPALKVVYVVEDDDERVLDGRPRGEQPAGELRRQPIHVSCRRRNLGEGARYRALQGEGEREPETLRLVIAGVQRDPFPGYRVQGLEPLRDGHGLPGGGTAGHQRHSPAP